MYDKIPFGEGAFINRPPLLCGLNYQFWKIRMNFFVQSTEKGILEAIENGHFIPKTKKDGVFTVKHCSEWTESDSKKAKFEWMAKNIITFALSCYEFFRVSQCESAKEMWDILEVTHEGTNDVKMAKKHALNQEYEMFKL